MQLELNGTIPTVNDGKINMTASNGVKMSSDSQNASANQSGNTTFKIEADTDSLNSTLNFAKTTDIGNGSIGIIEGTGINVTGSNATANQSSNSNWTINLNANLSQLNDVSDTTASNNQVLTYDNGTWKPAASQTGGVTELSALNDTNVDAPETGEILVYDKTSGKWNNQSPGENTAELPISSSDDTVKLSDDTTGGQTSNFIVETGTDVFKLVANASVFGKEYSVSMIGSDVKSTTTNQLIIDNTKGICCFTNVGIVGSPTSTDEPYLLLGCCGILVIVNTNTGNRWSCTRCWRSNDQHPAVVNCCSKLCSLYRRCRVSCNPTQYVEVSV